MSALSAEKAAEPARFERSFTIYPEFAGRMTVSVFRCLLSTPRHIVTMIVPAVFVPVIVALGHRLGGIAAVGQFVLVLVAAAAVYATILLISYFPARNQIRERLPVRSEYSIALSEDSMRLKDASITIDISYHLYKSLRGSAKVVVLVPRLGRRPTVLPVELFTPESLAWLRSRLKDFS